MDEAYRAISGPAFPFARRSVKATSYDRDFKKKSAWADLSHKIKDRPEWAEMTWRHLNANYLMHDDIAASTLSPVSKPDMNLLVELAYHHYAVAPRLSTNGNL
jgi:hypothetical protein